MYKGRSNYHLINPYVSGSGIIFTKDVVTTLVDNFFKYYYNVDMINDVLIGDILLKNKIYSQDMKCCIDLLYNDNIDIDIVNSDNKDIIHYRIKHESNYRLQYDTIVMNKLYDYYYLDKKL